MSQTTPPEPLFEPGLVTILTKNLISTARRIKRYLQTPISRSI